MPKSSQSLESIKFRLKYLVTTDIVIKAKLYAKLPWEKKQAIQQEYDTYYESCRNSESGQNFMKCLEAFRARDMKTVEECGKIARKHLESQEYVKRPIIFPYSPEELQNDAKIMEYKYLKHRYDELTSGNGDISL